MRSLWLGVVLVLSVAGVALTVTPPRTIQREADLRPVLLRPGLARTLARPFFRLLVDWYWLRTLNAIGDADSQRKNAALCDYGQSITDLDPKFYQAYVYPALNAPYRDPERWVNADLASALLRKGLGTFPTDMRLHMYLGFSLFHHERKFREAADVFSAASKLPDRLAWMPTLATRLYSHSGDAREARQVAQEIAAQEQDPVTRAELEQRVTELDVEIVLQDLDRAIAEFTAKQGRPPRDLDELRVAGAYAGPLEDAQGGTLSIVDGKARSTSLERRLVLYE